MGRHLTIVYCKRQMDEIQSYFAKDTFDDVWRLWSSISVQLTTGEPDL